MHRNLAYLVKVELINRCSNLPVAGMWHVRRALSWISPIDLDGLGFVELADKISDADESAAPWHRRARANGFSVAGVYRTAEAGEPPHVVLFIQDVYRGIPKALELTTAPTLLIARSLAHEVAHHIVRRRGYIFDQTERYDSFEVEEEMANRYAFSVLNKMTSRCHYSLGSWLTKRVAELHYIRGLTDWREGKYARAAERWYETWLLDPDREDAIVWYWKAKELVKQAPKSSLG